MRSAMGLSLLAQNAALDVAAGQHAKYLSLNFNNATMRGVDPSTGMLYFHSEDVGNPVFMQPHPRHGPSRRVMAAVPVRWAAALVVVRCRFQTPLLKGPIGSTL